MRPFLLIVVLLAMSDSALASQGPGTGPGTAGPMLQWLAAICGIGLATLGVVFARWDDGKYKDF
jgi:hypothetical protein